MVAAVDTSRWADEAGVEFVNGCLVQKPVSIESSEVSATVIAILKFASRKSGRARAFDSSLGYDEISGENAIPGFCCKVAEFFE